MTEVNDVASVNINIGILGHVDSGKTSLARALSSTASTAAFDKSPESQRRGITLDLGFSATCVPTEGIAPDLFNAGIQQVQCTFVDCPGHASLIRTVLGGAQIIDMMILVIDACKGIQTQTAECIVIGEVLCKPLVLVINKVDAIQGSTSEEKRAAIDKLRKRLQKTFERTRWPSVAMVEVAAAPRREESGGTTCEGCMMSPINVEKVLPAVLNLVDADTIKRNKEAPLRPEDFVMMVDHCFALKGQGTVFTGTILRGQVSVGDSVVIPESHVVKKVKGLQVFRKPVQMARRGDRVGLSVVQFDAEGMERGLLCSALQQQQRQRSRADQAVHPVPVFESASVMVAEVSRVRFHQLPCNVHTKFHINIGHSTVMGTMRFFSRPTVCLPSDSQAGEELAEEPPFDLMQESQYVEELGEEAFITFECPSEDKHRWPGRPIAVKRGPLTYFAIVLLEKPILAAIGTPLIAARLDVERENMCRIALAGRVRALLHDDKDDAVMWRSMPIVRYKSRSLVVERVVSDRSCIASGVVTSEMHEARSGGGMSTNKKERDTKVKDALHAEVQKFIGLTVYFRPTSGDDGCCVNENAPEGLREGIIDSAFGKTGKVKLVFKEPVFAVDDRGAEPGKGKRNEVIFLSEGVVELTLKKYPLALHSQLQQ
ncbi:selenocysteine-tRNA-specific elongation factor,putative [Trypanosoma brucei gambiense DAL972]|uniref:Selenocysteine-specific elongation factor n=1 Tax=Trypanosoma brucei gambiense (strain MHOM/CI/86/DAL972) TaxID=679716 RepID=C9ZM43_TRYB9|nr:selenocysteine-tRNA-specific elongation factor,putative [Trypanosoma brucei gambiense DAL972]CBH10468.1 selenocysteine-tRNA-specific elongation factor,putative [Trypanosoma brucei gambiense DAL972]|eukprot:XP_011772758.1 selenocysteine-tRNA-specific elongation factor,putative [Trypanosoma brucei gambiense DAL972]